MRVAHLCRISQGILVLGIGLWPIGSLCAEDASSTHTPSPEETEDTIHPWLDPIPTPTDPALESQIKEVQEALTTIHTQMLRRKERLRATPDASTKATLYDELEALRKEREDLEALLHNLVDEARLSERTAIDQAIARAKWLEQQQEQWDRKEESIRDRQQ